MSLDQPQKNRMMTRPPNKKGWHFSGGGIFETEFIEADTIDEALEIYNRTKRPIGQPTAAVTPEKSQIEQSTPEPEKENLEEGV